MKICTKAIIILICICSVNAVLAEEYPNWTGYPPMNAMTDVIEFRDIIYGTSESGVFSYDPVSRKYTFYFKNHGLDATNALSITATSDEIYVGFEYDGLMRFDPEAETFEPIIFPEYIDRENVLNAIAVNDIFALNDSILYIGHSDGVDRLNLKSEEIRTYSKLSVNIKEDTPVYEVKVVYGKIWACTLEGLAWADVDNQNLESEEEWDNYTFPRGVNCILDFVDENGDPSMYVGTDGKGIFTFDWATKDTSYTGVINTKVYGITEGLGTIIAVANDGLYKKTDEWLRNSSVTPLVDVIEGSDDKMWVASDDGLKCFINSGYWGIPPMEVPRTTELRKIAISDNNVLWAATSYRDEGGYVLRLENDKWESFDDVIDELPSFKTTSVTIDSRGVIWGATWDRGVYTLDDDNSTSKLDDTVTLVDTEKEILLQQSETNSNVVVADVATDEQGNIWVAGYDKGAYVLEGGLPLKEYKHNHFTFDEKAGVNYVTNVFPDNEGWVWLGTVNTGLIGIYIGADPYDTSDDVVRNIRYDESGEGLLGTRVEAVDIDKDGYIWVGSVGGLNRITKQAGNTLIIENMNEKHLGVLTVEVTSIEVDDDNNKWIGTTGGLMKLNSMDTLEQIYNVDNSGLLSNNILSMKLDNNGDYLWIGTIKGLNRLDVSNGASESFAQQFHMYPNPFEIWGDNSNAVFNNLKSDESVRIYNFTGELVNELNASDNGGSTAVWNGRNFRDEYVGSGVFFFTGVDKNGKMFKEKMVVIRR
ncbi:two-component regulator propeller domain-containing protein [Candidatus Latescibacterota bacterium]